MIETISKKTKAPVIISVFVLIGGLAMAPLSVYAESDDGNDDNDDNDDDNPLQFSDLGDTFVQEENVQGRTITGSVESMKITTVLMAAVFAAAILLAAGLIAAGLILFPDSERKVQANPCSVEEQGAGPYGDVDLDLDCEFDE